MEMVDTLPGKTDRLDSNIRNYIQCHIYPYQCIRSEHHDLVDEDLTNEIAYWNCHDISEYTRYLSESIEQSNGMYNTDRYHLTMRKMAIENNMDALFKTYLMMGRGTVTATKRSVWDRLNI